MRLRTAIPSLIVALPVFIGAPIFAQPDRAEETTAGSALVEFLSDWLERSRDDAIALGVERIPDSIRDTLITSVPPDVLNDVRWRIGGPGLAGRGLFAMNSAYAITLDNVIIFAGANEASEPGLWAHEIYHVMQFRKWGIEGFVTRYLADRRAVESEAKEFRYQWWKGRQ